jgi:hypothetical protein
VVIFYIYLAVQALDPISHSLAPLRVPLCDPVGYKLPTFTLAESSRASYFDGLGKFALGYQRISARSALNAGNESGFLTVNQAIFMHESSLTVTDCPT